MEKLSDSLPAIESRIKARFKNKKAYDKNCLWIRFSHALSRDGHLKRLGGNGFMVLYILYTRMNKNRIAYPSLNGIARESGLHRNTVQAVIDKLVLNGWIEKVGQIEKYGGKYGNMQYRLLEDDLIRGSTDPNYLVKPVTKIGIGESSVPVPESRIRRYVK
ncbi:helix-turn-helix domain-containing protein [Candidatus Curtissbacteria bacterium]|nr:helix-turn-helix domain-containing protein [Candidatus Curtissbacteria bacterium]